MPGSLRPATPFSTRGNSSNQSSTVFLEGKRFCRCADSLLFSPSWLLSVHHHVWRTVFWGGGTVEGGKEVDQSWSLKATKKGKHAGKGSRSQIGKLNVFAATFDRGSIFACLQCGQIALLTLRKGTSGSPPDVFQAQFSYRGTSLTRKRPPP